MRIGGSSATSASSVDLGSAPFTAARDVGGHRVVFIDDDGAVAHASASTLAQFERVLGITESAALAGGLVRVRWAGEMREPSWSGRMRPGPVWLGEDGALTVAPPRFGFSQQVGLYVPDARLIIAIGDPVQLTFGDP